MAESWRVKRKGDCKCGQPYMRHPRCKRCEKLIHNDKQFCAVNEAGEYEGYVTTRKRMCYPCKEAIRQEKMRDPKYRHRLEIQRRASKAYRVRNLEKMREKEKLLAKKNGVKMRAVKKMKIAASALEHNKVLLSMRKFRSRHPDYYTAVARRARKEKHNANGQAAGQLGSTPQERPQ